MAKLIGYGFLQGIRGKLGDKVYFQRNGETYVRACPKKREGRSPAQKQQQDKFHFLTKFISPLCPYLHKMNKEPLNGKTIYGQIFSVNYHQALSGDYPNCVIDYSKVILGKGNIRIPNNPVLSSPKPGYIDIQWSYECESCNSSCKDKLFLALFNEEMREWLCYTEIAERDQKSCTIHAGEFQGKNVHVYFGFTSYPKRFSDSVYLGQVEIL